MVIVAHISRDGSPVAEATYRSGMHVEVRVAQEYESAAIDIPLTHSDNSVLRGSWEKALDDYFNEGTFNTKGNLFPGEMNRVGSARDHKLLFRQAAHALRKDLEPRGYEVEVEFV
jgi:hypothetical protein